MEGFIEFRGKMLTREEWYSLVALFPESPESPPVENLDPEMREKRYEYNSTTLEKARAILGDTPQPSANAANERKRMRFDDWDSSPTKVVKEKIIVPEWCYAKMPTVKTAQENLENAPTSTSSPDQSTDDDELSNQVKKDHKEMEMMEKRRKYRENEQELMKEKSNTKALRLYASVETPFKKRSFPLHQTNQ